MNNSDQLEQINLKYRSANRYAKICDKAHDVFDIMSKVLYTAGLGTVLISLGLISYTIINSDPNTLLFKQTILIIRRLRYINCYGGALSLGFIAGGFISKYISNKFYDYSWFTHYKMDQLVERARTFGI
jgi:hypothetical protein